MKSRSHALPPSDPPDDWVDGSWTVDCSCGVTFDDGEEMVSCDECGVWVHTRCSRFVKGEASFACHNCKKSNSSNNNNNSTSNSSKKPSLASVDTEETEVAQLLIELPTKSPPPNPFPGPTCRPPFRLWAEVPLEDKVHVQGVPGGDPGLFQGMKSSVFTQELWKCTGYVPKKFNFQYREFSCWDEDGAENTASRGADVLFSLSKEILPVRGFERKQDGEKVLFGGRLQSWGKKERNKLRVFGAHSSKRRKEEVGDGKERSGKKKKARSSADKVAAEFKKRVSVPVPDREKPAVSEDGGPLVMESEVPVEKNEEKKEVLSSQDNVKPDDQVEGEVTVDQVEKMDAGDQAAKADSDSKPKHVLVIKTSKGGTAGEPSNSVNTMDLLVKLEAEDGATGISLKAEVAAASQEKDDDVEESVKEEDVSKAAHGLQQPEGEKQFQGEPYGPTQAKLVSSGSCEKDDDLNQPVCQPPSKHLSHPLPVHAPTSTSAAGEEDVNKVAQGLKESKDDNHLQGNVNASIQAKLVSSGSCQKNEKLNQPVSQPLSKLLSHSMSMHPPASVGAASTLSDEELALLLHQELNSSPRVPRVPRMRQTSGMQLTSSQSVPSMLSKRSFHSGGRDQVIRRKNREELSRDVSRTSQESSEETKKVGRSMSSHDRKYRESSITVDGSAKKDSRGRSPDTLASTKKNVSGSIGGEKKCQPTFETASGQNAYSVRRSPRDFPDVENATRTLPGLINEILSKHRCSTYKELCDAVRPHWHKVRKPNGERYAYSSPSHAVLDCLRNRSEWAHLIDRGPKTNCSKRRRKFDSEPTIEESENEEADNKESSKMIEDDNGDSHREDYPKGKRKARKRRKLELQGRSMEGAKKRKRITSSESANASDDDDNEDDEAAAFSHSSNEGVDVIFSEDESQGATDHTVGAEASASPSSDGSR